MKFDQQLVGKMLAEYETSNELASAKFRVETPESDPVLPLSKPIQARTLSKTASVLLVEDGRILIHLDGNPQNNVPENCLAFWLNIDAKNYVEMSPQEKRVWDYVNRSS